ncbi:MAG: sigma 54-interacting transcriptional regulator [Polyangiaceae bacterium]|nr:sigma 54-interacting transcriptional regulator [Polyangiaceae bacterium]
MPDETSDPLPREPAGERAQDEAVVELLYHPDLSRWGDLTTLDDDEHRVAVGREDPSFGRRGAGARPLGDPCVSREQLIIERARGGFTVTAAPGARREITVYGPTGAALSRRSPRVPAGSLVAIGDRALLCVDVRPRESARDDLGLVGASTAMRRVRERIRALADSPDVTLVTGEPGTGKELAARALHDASKRRQGPWIPVNCAALPEALAESELFGHARGAFTGASADRAGLFHAAAGGTLFLDEIGELSPPMQAKLLRALEVGAVRPVGATHEVPTHARVVCATNRELRDEVAAGRFRADLWSRLAGLELALPPLATRLSDVPALFAHLLAPRVEREPRAAWLMRAADRHAAPIPLEWVLGLLSRAWGGNVREVARLAAAVATHALLGEPFRDPYAAPPARAAAPAVAGARPDRATLLRALADHDHVAQRAARALGVPRSTLHRWLREEEVRQPRDLSDQEIDAAVRASGGDLGRAAALLGVSERGLKLRLGPRGDG